MFKWPDRYDVNGDGDVSLWEIDLEEDIYDEIEEDIEGPRRRWAELEYGSEDEFDEFDSDDCADDYDLDSDDLSITTDASSDDEVFESNLSLSQKNALRSAMHYLDSLDFSYSGLIEQLEYEGYPHSDAVYAADNCGADWCVHAANAAHHYLECMPFSRSGLAEQLEFEGYTKEQIEYALAAVGY